MLNLGIMSKVPKIIQQAASMRNGEEVIFGFILLVLRFFWCVITLVVKATTKIFLLFQNHLVLSVVPRITYCWVAGCNTIQACLSFENKEIHCLNAMMDFSIIGCFQLYRKCSTRANRSTPCISRVCARYARLLILKHALRFSKLT